MIDAERIAPARVRMEEHGPYSLDFSDIYHSADGVGEVQRVFLEPAGLMTNQITATDLWVGELGFGSALNFAVLAQRCSTQGRALHFVSCEAAPLAPHDFKRLAAERAGQLPIYAELADVYPPLIRGWHRRHLADGRITLSAFWGDADDALEHLTRHRCRRFHAWFLDGFAPDRNPRMWASPLLEQLGALSLPGATVTTFTAAGHVRRSLQAAGFAMRRVDQRPHKRESLAGRYGGFCSAVRGAPQRATVVGAGLAGASVARQLARRGVAVRVLERANRPASGASGIPVSMLHARLLANASPQAQVRCHAYLYSATLAARLTRSMEPAGPGNPGALQLPGGNTDRERLEAVAERYQHTGSWLAPMDRAEVARSSHWPAEHAGLWFPDARAVNMADLCHRLLDHPNITVSCSTPLDHLPDPGEHPLVLACGINSRSYGATAYLELAPVHGQIDIVQVARPPALPLLGNGYLVPCRAGLALGSTYEYSPWDPDRATHANLARLPPAQQAKARVLSHARGTRCVSSDRLPVVGPVFDQSQQAIANLYVSTGMGSMGNVFSHYAGELLASMICAEFPPADDGLMKLMSSLRFRTRQARRGHRFGTRD